MFIKLLIFGFRYFKKPISKIINRKRLINLMKLTNIKSKEVIKILLRKGFEIKRQSGTPVILKNNEKFVVVPIHKEVMPVGTLKSIEKQSGINFREAIS